MVLAKRLTVFSDLLHKRVLSIEKKITFGLSTIMESLQSQSSPSVWHLLSKTISLTLSLVATTLHRSLVVSKLSKLSKIIQETTNQT
jgi:hypothetical protein